MSENKTTTEFLAAILFPLPVAIRNIGGLNDGPSQRSVERSLDHIRQPGKRASVRISADLGLLTGEQYFRFGPLLQTAVGYIRLSDALVAVVGRILALVALSGLRASVD